MLAAFHGLNIRHSPSIQKEALWTRELVILNNAKEWTDEVVRTDGKEKNTKSLQMLFYRQEIGYTNAERISTGALMSIGE